MAVKQRVLVTGASGMLGSELVLRAPESIVAVGTDVRADLTLSVGAVKQEVTVTAAAAILQTENATVGQEVTSTRVESIDINGRNFIQLANLVPGASGQSLVGSFNTPVGVTANAGINFNGERQSHNVFSVDGQENYDRGCGGCIEIVPDQDAIQEFKVLTSNAQQDLGFGSAAHIQMEIKSGTNPSGQRLPRAFISQAPCAQLRWRAIHR